VPIKVTVAEGKPTRLQFGVGYGSENGPRGSFEYHHYNFLGDARQLATTGRYSGRLQGADIGLVEPYLFTRGLSFGVQASGWWRDEPTYTSRSFGGRATMTSRWSLGRGLQVSPVEHTLRLTYLNESLRYAVAPDVLADLTQFEEFIALGFDPVTGEGAGRQGALRVDFDRLAVDQQLDPRSGHALSLDVTHAAEWLGGTFDYDEFVGEARVYVPAGEAVLAGRARAGVITASSPQAVPFSARYFLGGSSNLRGWGRFQVAPLTGDGLPIGGQALVELSAEVRVPIVGSLGFVGFVDAGNVWATRREIDITDLRVDVGPGLRYTSPIGVVRADIGFQLTPIAGLIVSGEPETRRWRVHFSIGQAF
jgi:outer membrane protein insertion porin family